MPTRGDYLTIEPKNSMVATGVLLLTRRLKDVLPAADRNELSDPILGMGQVNSLAIMTHFRTQCGMLTSQDYKLLYIQLTQKLDTAMNFSGYAADQRFILEQLAAQAQPVPELQKCDYLRTGSAHLLPIEKAINSYLTAHPRTATQTFATLVEHIILHAANFSQTSLNVGYTAAASHITPTSNFGPDFATTFLSSPAFLAALTTAAAAAATSITPRQPRPPRNRGSRDRRPPPSAAPAPVPRTYCFAHGYDSHGSADCY